MARYERQHAVDLIEAEQSPPGPGGRTRSLTSEARTDVKRVQNPTVNSARTTIESAVSLPDPAIGDQPPERIGVIAGPDSVRTRRSFSQLARAEEVGKRQAPDGVRVEQHRPVRIRIRRPAASGRPGVNQNAFHPSAATERNPPRRERGDSAHRLIGRPPVPFFVAGGIIEPYAVADASPSSAGNGSAGSG